MGKNIVWFVVVVIVGALLGSFLGKSLAMALPDSSITRLFATDISAGLAPANLNLRIVEFTFGCMFRLNVMSVIGIVLAALIFTKIAK